MNENAKYGGQITMRYLSFRTSSWWQTTHDLYTHIKCDVIEDQH